MYILCIHCVMYISVCITAGHGMQWLPGQQYGIPPMLPGLDSDPEPHPHIPPWSHQHTL